ALDNWRKEGKREDLLTNLDLNLKATDWLNITYRAGLTSKSINERNSSKGELPTQGGLDRGFSLIQGAIQERSYKNTRLSSEAFATFNKAINEDFKVNGNLGTYLRQNDIRDTRVGASNLVVTELFNVGNRTGELSGTSPRSRSRLFSLYASAGVGYKGWANLEVTGRQDKTSLLGLNNNTFFYPGVSGSLVLTEAIGALKNKNTVSYLKLRGAWNKTGNADINPYLLAATFSQPLGFPFGSLPGYTANNTTYDANLEPEFIETIEAGIEAGFLDGRINLEATYYNQNNDNQIIPISVSSATGYTSANVNAASFINKGIELDLKLTPLVKLGGVNIEFRANATLSDSEIKSVYEGLNELAIGGFVAAGNFAIKGSPAFVIKATDYLRDPQGRIIVNATTGFPTTDPNTKTYGRTLPKWILGLNPSASWKGISFSTLLEYKGGHYAYHGIGSDMAWTGVSAATAQNNRERFVMPNSSINTGTAEAPVYVANTSVAVSNTNDFFIGAFNNTASNFLTSAAAWRLREASLGFAVPQRFLAKQGVIKGMNIALTGRNLFLWVPKTNEFQDPDFNFTSENTAGISDSQINPPTRIFGGNVTITF
ncbi:MAG: TonB-dependent receptor, partial [Pyrinomonadaceae bacterium]|nr:TonB-dependent receptor [Sphingobacteriaceae bacterium]